jgi:phosphatidylinositol 3-kinase
VSKPHAVTLDTSAGEIQVLIKTADLRKDKCTMVLCQMLQRMGIRCLVYPVFVTPRGGWVQMLASKTLYELGNSLSTYVYNQFPNTPPKITKAKFRRSVVGSCILSYIIGLGDRHLQNIVVCNGELTHIDFSYMFGHDPKITQPLRVTAPTIQMMGGKDSPEYALFLCEVQEAFETVRAQRSLWCTLLENIAHAELYTLSEIRRHAKLIGSPGVKVVDIVKNHSDTWVHALGDVVHGIFQFKF